MTLPPALTPLAQWALHDQVLDVAHCWACQADANTPFDSLRFDCRCTGCIRRANEEMSANGDRVLYWRAGPGRPLTVVSLGELISRSVTAGVHP